MIQISIIPKNYIVIVLLFMGIIIYAAPADATAQNAGSIAIAQVETEPGSQVTLAVTTTGFENVIVAEVWISIDPAILEYLGITNVHPQLANGALTTPAGSNVSTVAFTWLGFGNPRTLSDGTILFNLNFEFCNELYACALAGSSTAVEILINRTYLLNSSYRSIPLQFEDGSVSSPYALGVLEISTTGNGHVLVDGQPYQDPIVLPENTLLQLEAVAGQNSLFDGWSGHPDDLALLEDPGSPTTGYTMPGREASLVASFADDDVETVPESLDVIDDEINDGEEQCYNALQTITTGGNDTYFVVNEGGSATLIAGHSIRLLPGTQVKHGGQLHAYITSDGIYCDGPIVKNIAHELPLPTDDEALDNETYRMDEKPFFRIFPNPSNGVFELVISKVTNDGSATIQIFNSNGNMIKSETLPAGHQHTINISDQKAGLYLVRLIAGDFIEVQRIVVN